MEFLLLENIDPAKAVNPSQADRFIRFNSRTNLIEGLNNQKEPTGSLYNLFITEGEFFKIVNNTNKKDRSFMSAGDSNYIFGYHHILINYLGTLSSVDELPTSGENYDTYYINNHKNDYDQAIESFITKELKLGKGQALDIIEKTKESMSTPVDSFTGEKWAFERTETEIDKNIKGILIYEEYISFNTSTRQLFFNESQLERDVQSGHITEQLASQIKDMANFLQNIVDEEPSIVIKATALSTRTRELTPTDVNEFWSYTIVNHSWKPTNQTEDSHRAAYRTLDDSPILSVKDYTVFSGDGWNGHNELEFHYNYY